MRKNEVAKAKELLMSLNKLCFKLLGIRLTRHAPIGHDLRLLDLSAANIMKNVTSRTMTDENRLHNLILAVRYVVNESIPGAVVECGVWRGGSMMAAALTLLEFQDTSRDLYLYDTYQGMTAPQDLDRDFKGALAKDHILNAQTRQGEYSSDVTAYASLPDVKSGMQSTNYPIEKIKYVVGDVTQTLNGDQIPKEIALLRLDTDWYESTKIELEILWSRVARGGVVILDDYDHWKGAKKAVDDFFATCSNKPFLMKMSSGRLIVKIH